MSMYEMWTSGNTEEIEADDLQDALDQCEDWLRDGDWFDLYNLKSVILTGYVEELDEDGERNGEYGETTIVVDPDEPKCDGYEHLWCSGNVWGRGAGVMYTENCVRCGCQKTTNTWDQNPENGEQGFTTIQYEENCEDINNILTDILKVARASEEEIAFAIQMDMEDLWPDSLCTVDEDELLERIQKAMEDDA